MSSPRVTPAASEARCCCGALLARLVEGGIELKCRRCRRRMIVPLDGLPAHPPGDGEGAAHTPGPGGPPPGRSGTGP